MDVILRGGGGSNMGKVEMERSTGLPFLSNMICGLDMNGQRSGQQLGEETEHALPPASPLHAG